MKGCLSVEERISRIFLIEKINRNKEYSESLGLENKSFLYGDTITKPLEQNSTCKSNGENLMYYKGGKSDGVENTNSCL